jgi:predicted transcriptional regulator
MMQRMRMQKGAREKPETSERRTFSLPVSTARRLDFEASRSGRSVSSILREALEAFLEGQQPPELPSFVGIAGSASGDLSERVEDELRERFARERT